MIQRAPQSTNQMVVQRSTSRLGMHSRLRTQVSILGIVQASCSGSQPGIMSVLDQGIATSLQSPPASPAGVSNPRLSSVLVQQNNDQNRTSLNYDQEFEKKKQLILHELEIEINLGQQSVAEVDDLHRQAMDQHTSKYQRRRTEIRGFSNINPDLLSDEEVRELYFKKINNDIIEFRRTKLAVHLDRYR